MSANINTEPRIRIIRLTRNADVQTLGEVMVHLGRNKLFSGVTLERWSGIASGAYWGRKFFSSGLKRVVILLENVPDHSEIEIHNGNYFKDSKLCILVGEAFTDIDGDGNQDVTNSVFTLERIISLVPDRVRIMIYDDKTYLT